jgi:hypothetical protein
MDIRDAKGRVAEIVEAMFAEADRLNADAEQIRPAGDELDGGEEEADNAIATALDERAAATRAWARRLGAEFDIIDTMSAGSCQTFIETGRYLAPGEAEEYAS